MAEEKPLGRVARSLEIAKPKEVDILQIGDVRLEVKCPRVASYGKFVALTKRIAAGAPKPAPVPAKEGDPSPAPPPPTEEEIQERFEASLDVVLLCVPGLERKALEDLPFQDFMRVVEFVQECVEKQITAREKAGVSDPFSRKPSPSGGTSGSGSQTSSTSTLATSAP